MPVIRKTKLIHTVEEMQRQNRDLVKRRKELEEANQELRSQLDKANAKLEEAAKAKEEQGA